MRKMHLSAHWVNGGTGLTNFGPEQFHLYEQAVINFGNPDFVVSSLRMDGRGYDMPGGSLHYVGKLSDAEGWDVVSKFWNEFRQVEGAMEYARVAV